MMTLLERFEWVLENRFQKNKSKGATEWSEAARVFRGEPEKARTDPYVGVQLHRFRKGETPSLGLKEMVSLGRVADVDMLWWLTGEGRPERSTPLTPEEDARRWFLHRVEHEGIGTEAEARAWLESNAPAFTRPVPWNNHVFLAYKRSAEAGVQPVRVLDELADDPRESAIVLVLRDHPKSAHKGIRAKLAAAALAKDEQNTVESWLARFKAVLGGKAVSERGAKGGKADREAKQSEARTKAQFTARKPTRT